MTSNYRQQLGRPGRACGSGGGRFIPALIPQGPGCFCAQPSRAGEGAEGASPAALGATPAPTSHALGCTDCPGSPCTEPLKGCFVCPCPHAASGR